MTKQEMLSKIYEVMANKELSFGCMVKHIDRICKIVEIHEYHYFCVSDMEIYTDADDGAYYNNYRVRGLEWGEYSDESGGDICEIIGHPVLLGDVLDWGYKNSDNYLDRFCYEDFVMEIVNRREETRLPIDQQSDECIKYVYDLVCNV